jgi:hypothetical protein
LTAITGFSGMNVLKRLRYIFDSLLGEKKKDSRLLPGAPYEAYRFATTPSQVGIAEALIVAPFRRSAASFLFLF